MSYCRWSTDDFNCDLYCYEDAHGGWTTHVAANRHVGACPIIDETSPERMAATYNAQFEFLRVCERVPLGLEHDGATFNDPTLEAFKARLLMLREMGYRFPDDVLAEIDVEMLAIAAN